jgi:beta-lactamase class D
MHGADGQHGSLYGKTGSGTDEKGVGNLGWYVGWLTSAGRTYTFACMIQTTGASGVKARELSTDVFSRLKML